MLVTFYIYYIKPEKSEEEISSSDETDSSDAEARSESDEEYEEEWVDFDRNQFIDDQ